MSPRPRRQIRQDPPHEQPVSRRRFLCTTAALTLGASTTALVACNPNTAGSGQQAQPAASKLPPVIVFASSTGQEDLPYFERYQKWFEEQHPGTKVDLLLPPGEGSYNTKLLAMFAADTYPDVFHLHFTAVREFWAKGTLHAMDQFIKTQNAPMEDFISGVMVPYKIKGQTWGLPRDNATGVMYYNEEMLTSNGAQIPTATWRWDTDFLEAAKRVTSVPDQRFGMVFPNITSIGDQHLEIYRTWGAEWYDAEMKEARVNTPQAVDAIQFMVDLRMKHHVSPLPGETPSGDQFQNGWAAMTNQWQGYVRRVKQSAASFKWNVSPLFRGPQGSKAVNVVGTTGHGIPKGAKNPEAGFALTLFLLSERVQKDMMSQGRWTTPRKSLLKYALPEDGIPTRYQEAIIDRLAQAQGYATPVAYAELNQVWRDETAPVWLGQRPVKAALDAVNVQWDRLLKQFPSN